MIEHNPDFIAILPAINRHGLYHCVAVRKYHAPEDGYITTKCSNPLRREVAELLAREWAVWLKLEVR